MKLFVSILLFCLGWLFSFSCNGEEKIKYVNPFIGTSQTLKPSNWEGHGRTYPGAVAPFGYIQLSPETRVSADKGYDYRDNKIYFFSSFGHRSGYPNGSAGSCFIMPIENQASFQLRKNSRTFSHLNEIAEPGYYKVEFIDNETTVETTASTRAGMFRFSYKSSIIPKVFIGDIGEFELIADSIIKGRSRHSVLEFNTKWSSVEKISDGIILTFEKQLDKTLLLKLSSSSVSFNNAQENLELEVPHWNFDRLKNETQNAWEAQLSVIEVKEGSIQNKTKFYSALYHSMLLPWIDSDYNGEYKGADNKTYKAKGINHYNTFSPWDTFRSLHPLLCIVAPQRQNDMIISMLEIFEQSNQLPDYPMTGYHSIPMIVDSYFKNITNFDKDLAYKAMKESVVNAPFIYEDMLSYISKGYVPSTFPESVTRTVEYAYNDWALSQYAKNVMNNSEDYLALSKRGFNYRNLFDPEQLFLVPRENENFIKSNGNFGFKEGDKWNYSFFVPHNPRDLINLMGNDEEFTNLLDSAIHSGRILFDNEPNFHIPYLFNYSKKPSKTQEWVSKIRELYFTANEGGLPGNDDLGSMSSWFVFNALGFYPVCPGVPEYNIGTPLFGEVVIHTEGNKQFVIKGASTSLKNKYIKSASLNGEKLNKSWFSHSSIIKDGELNFVMDSVPSLWATQSNSAAYSATINKSDIVVNSISTSKRSVEPHESFWVKFYLKNIGSTGVEKVRVLVNGVEKAVKNVFVKEDNSIIDSISCRLYKPGLTELMIYGSDERTRINVKESNHSKMEYSQLSYSALIQDTAKQQIRFLIKNIGGAAGNSTVNIYLNDKLFKTDTIFLEPGETKKLKYNITGFGLGMNKIEVGNLVEAFKVFDKNSSATLVDLNFKNGKMGQLPDQSGLSNHGIIKSINPLIINKKGFDDTAFVEIKTNSTFSVLKNEITLMAWVKVSKQNKQLSSIITQGDHNVIQLIDNHQIEFFIGGWGRGICLVDLPNPIIGQWHHIAGVCDGKSLKVYVDGELKGTAELNNYAPLNAHENWSLGRNEEFPNKRIFYGEMDDVKICITALSKKEIDTIIKNEKNKY